MASAGPSGEAATAPPAPPSEGGRSGRTEGPLRGVRRAHRRLPRMLPAWPRRAETPGQHSAGGGGERCRGPKVRNKVCAVRND
eukprot:814320-Prorocentrum_minimum.AAC.2